MTMAGTGELVEAAREVGRGLGAFNVIGLEHAEGIMAGAERSGAPVVLQVSENTVAYHGGRLAPIGRACIELAGKATVPTAVHLDHATSAELCAEAMALGFGSVMFDGSGLEYGANVTATAAVVVEAHRRGVFVEAELGEIGGKNGVHAPDARTDPLLAARYVAATGVDALAVAIGTSHAMVRKEAVLDLDLLARLHHAVPIPLVLHGSSGVPDHDLRAAVRAGIVKVNVGTQLNQAFTGACRRVLDEQDSVDPRPFLRAGRDAIADAVARVLGVLSAAK